MKPHYETMNRRAALAMAALCGASPVLAGCDALTLDREPEVAHLEIDSADVGEVTLIISQWFIRIADPECDQGEGCATITHLVQADTATVSLPFEDSYPFDFRLQFYAETYPTAGVPASLAMKVHLDDEEWYNDSRLLLPEDGDSDQETLKFEYEYNQATLPTG